MVNTCFLDRCRAKKSMAPLGHRNSDRGNGSGNGNGRGSGSGSNSSTWKDWSAVGFKGFDYQCNGEYPLIGSGFGTRSSKEMTLTRYGMLRVSFVVHAIERFADKHK